MMGLARTVTLTFAFFQIAACTRPPPAASATLEPATTTTPSRPAPAPSALPCAAPPPAPAPASARPTAGDPCDKARSKPAPLPQAIVSPARATTPKSIRIHVQTEADPFMDCVAHQWVTRSVPAGADPIETALDELVRGPNAFEKQNGLRPAFGRSVSEPQKPRLSRGQVKVTVKNAVAVVDFDPSASHHLEQAICARTAVTSAFELTLLQFKHIKEVHFAIGGVVITEWDA